MVTKSSTKTKKKPTIYGAVLVGPGRAYANQEILQLLALPGAGSFHFTAKRTRHPAPGFWTYDGDQSLEESNIVVDFPDGESRIFDGNTALTDVLFSLRTTPSRRRGVIWKK